MSKLGSKLIIVAIVIALGGVGLVSLSSQNNPNIDAPSDDLDGLVEQLELTYDPEEEEPAEEEPVEEEQPPVNESNIEINAPDHCEQNVDESSSTEGNNATNSTTIDISCESSTEDEDGSASESSIEINTSIDQSATSGSSSSGDSGSASNSNSTNIEISQ